MKLDHHLALRLRRTHVRPLPQDVVDSLDEGIRRLVVALRAYGFDTCDSGMGLGQEKDETAVLDVPHVFIRSTHYELTADAMNLCVLLQGWGVPLSVMGSDTGAQVQATFDPNEAPERRSVILLLNVSDKDLPDDV